MAGNTQSRKGGSFGYVLKTVLIVLVLGALAWLAADKFILGDKGRSTSITSANIELRLKDIGELATQAGYFTNVQDISNSRTIFGVKVPFTQSRYIYSYDGVVKAGINFEEVKAAVDEDAKAVTVRLPAPQILDVTVDEDSLYVYHEKESAFTPLKLTDINNSTAAMKNEVRKKAVDNGILENARSNAETLIAAFVRNMFPDESWRITFEWADQYGR